MFWFVWLGSDLSQISEAQKTLVPSHTSLHTDTYVHANRNQTVWTLQLCLPKNIKLPTHKIKLK